MINIQYLSDKLPKTYDIEKKVDTILSITNPQFTIVSSFTTNILNNNHAVSYP